MMLLSFHSAGSFRKAPVQRQAALGQQMKLLLKLHTSGGFTT